MEAYNYYKKNTMSIEILKDDHLQKVNFRVKNKVSYTTVLISRLERNTKPTRMSFAKLGDFAYIIIRRIK